MPPTSVYYVTVYRKSGDPRGMMALDREPVRSLQNALVLADKYVSARTEHVPVPWKAEIRGEGVERLMFDIPPYEHSADWNRMHLVLNDGVVKIIIEREDVARDAHYEEVMEGNRPAPLRSVA